MIKKLIKNQLKKLPGFRKLVLFFNKIRCREAEVSSLEAKVSSLEVKGNCLEAEESSLNAKGDCLEAKVSSLNAKGDCLEAKVSSLEAEVSSLEAEVERLRHRAELKLQLLGEGLDNAKLELLRTFSPDSFDRPRLAVYTSLIGNYDELQTPLVVEQGCDYFCLTDNPNLKSLFWKVILVENKEGLDSVRFQRKTKLMPHLYFPQYTHSLYVDASILIRGSVWDWIERNTTGKPWLVFQHPERDCVYQEAEACKTLQKDNSELIDAQMVRYRKEGYPEHNGMTWNAIIYRRHMESAVIALEEAWFDEILKGSRRDQLSFNYVCWKNGFQYDVCKEDYHLSFLWAMFHNGMPY